MRVKIFLASLSGSCVTGFPDHKHAHVCSLNATLMLDEVRHFEEKQTTLCPHALPSYFFYT